jgi:branched-chain amino acid transport system ATP-binding protein
VTTAPVLETRGLGRRFGGVRAVDDVSIKIQEGTTLGVIGPNGAGKSTLINLVTGHIRPSAGTVLVDGRDVTAARPWVIARAGVGRTFQVVKPFRGMSVLENVVVSALHGARGGTTTRSAYADAAAVLDRVGLAGKARVAPSELTVADARRLEFAKALALRPRLLLLDEVMAGLRSVEIDPSLELIHQLKSEGVTIVCVEHVMKAILAISDEVLVLHQGRVLTQGKPRDVLADERVIEAYLGRRYGRRREP